ncbi:MAG: DUF1150 family protein [Pseudomonadota bacterium]
MQEQKRPLSESADAIGKERRMVYIRPVVASDVMGELENAFGESEIKVEADAILYSVHDEDGERLALVGDRDLAFAAARQYELTPVSVH